MKVFWAFLQYTKKHRFGFAASMTQKRYFRNVLHSDDDDDDVDAAAAADDWYGSECLVSEKRLHHILEEYQLGSKVNK